MDEMKLSTPFIRRLVGRLTEKLVKNKFGKKVKVDFQKIYARVDDQGAKLTLNVDVQMSKEEFEKLCNQIL